MTSKSRPQATPTNNYIIVLASFFLALFIPNLLFGHYPYLGIAIVGIFLANVIFFLRSERGSEEISLYVFSILFSLGIVLRSNLVLQIIFGLALLVSLSLLSCTFRDKYRPYLLLSLPILLLLQVIRNKYYSYESYSFLLKKLLNNINISPANIIFSKISVGNVVKGVFTLFVSLVSFFVVNSLLANSNQIYKEYSTSFWQFIPQSIVYLNTIFSLSFFSWFNLNLGIFILIFAPVVLSSVQNQPKSLSNTDINTDTFFKFLIPKIVLTIPLIIFIIAQIQLYTGSVEILQKYGLTASQRVQDIFAQLSLVSLIVYCLLYCDIKIPKPVSKYFTYILLLLTAIICYFAWSSNMYYIIEFGLSLKRFYGVIIVFWLIWVSFVLAYKTYVSIDHQKILKILIYSLFVFVVAIGLVNPDGVIYYYNQPTFDSAKSFDAVPLMSSDTGEIENLIELYETNTNVRNQANSDLIAKQAIQKEYYNSLQDKYCNKPISLGFNLAEYLEVSGECRTSPKK